MIGIYKLENQVTHEIYIGQSIHIESRFQQHKRTALNNERKGNKLYDALRKDLDNFTFEIIEECCPEKLNEREIYWVAYYDSFHNGLNSNQGGLGKIYNNDIIFILWDEGKSVGEIVKILKCSPTTVNNYLQGYSNYSCKESNRRGGIQAFLTASASENERIIYQFSLNGDLLKSYPSIKAAERETNIDENSIRKVIQKERNSAGGFLWSTEPKIEIKKIGQGIATSIKQYSLDGKFIAEYPSANAAARAMGRKDGALIRRVCNDSTKTAYGFRWIK